jgi:pyruvate dehydrogenase E2 component (dihydrolipoamide acetyltransferase)
MPINIAEIIADVQAIRTKIQAAITASEHVFKTSVGVVNTGQLPNAAGALQTAVTNLTGHANIVETNAAQVVIDTLQQKIAAAKTLGQDPAPFELQLQALLKPKPAAPAAAIAPAAPAPAASAAPKAPSPTAAPTAPKASA